MIFVAILYVTVTCYQGMQLSFPQPPTSQKQKPSPAKTSTATTNVAA